MSDGIRSGTPEGTGGPDHHPEIDWEAAERSPEFRELVRRKNRFVVPATLFFLAWYFGFIILAGYAEDFMGREFIWDGLTVGYVLALTQFLMVWALGAWYLRRADRAFDPLAQKAADAALRTERGAVEAGVDETTGAGRFERQPDPTQPRGEVTP